MCVILQEWLNCAINMDHLLHSLRHVHVRSFLSFTEDDKNSHTVSHCRSSLRLDGPANFVKFIFFYFSTFLFCRIIMSYFLVKVRDFILSYILHIFLHSFLNLSEFILKYILNIILIYILIYILILSTSLIFILIFGHKKYSRRTQRCINIQRCGLEHFGFKILNYS